MDQTLDSTPIPDLCERICCWCDQKQNPCPDAYTVINKKNNEIERLVEENDMKTIIDAREIKLTR